MYATITSVSLFGLHGIMVGVEADIQPGLPSFEIVGLPASAIKEARERVRSAILNSGYVWPRSRITVSLSPADLRKEGSGLDLSIAIAILVSSEQMLPVANNVIVLGELALDGAIRSFQGFYAAIAHALSFNLQKVIIPLTDRKEIEGINSQTILSVKNLNQAVSALNGNPLANDHNIVPKTAQNQKKQQQVMQQQVNFNDVFGQDVAKRVLEIAASGSHHILLYGAPGTGKTMLAERLPTILPPLEMPEVIEVKKIYSVAGLPISTDDSRPFRAPHHTITTSGLLGGGSTPHPGEVSLAHRGVLFLDEFPEFSRMALEGLRQPLSTGLITITRALYSYTFPSDFILIAAMNPCPCGFYGSEEHVCTCTTHAIDRYQKKLSGPILDRIDLSIWVEGASWSKLTESRSYPNDSSESIKQRVTKSREFKKSREYDHKIFYHTPSFQPIRSDMDDASIQLFLSFAEKNHISLRSAEKLSRVARTIADMEQSEVIQKEHFLEAILYRTIQTERF